MQETVTVQYVNPAQAGKKRGSIKTSTGEYIGVWPNELALFQQGQTYVIEIEMNGQYKNFAGFAGQAAAAPQQPQGQPQPNGSHRPAQGGDKSEDMAVMGIVGRCFHGTGQLPDQNTLSSMMQNVRLAWRNSSQSDAPF